jgi:hypothetical protein
MSMKIQNLDRLGQKLDSWKHRRRNQVKEATYDSGLLIEEGAKALAPHLDGDLEGAINTSSVEETSQGYEVTVGIHQGIPYAVRMHEEHYEPGEITQSKDPYKGHDPGRKYLENSRNVNKPLVKKAISEAAKYRE